MYPGMQFLIASHLERILCGIIYDEQIFQSSSGLSLIDLKRETQLLELSPYLHYILNKHVCK